MKQHLHTSCFLKCKLHIRKNTLLLLALAIASGAQAQSTFFPTKAGSVQTYAQKDGKGKVQSHTRNTIKEVVGSGNNMSIAYTVESLDKNKQSMNPPAVTPCKVVIKDGVVIMDMSEMFTGVKKDPQMKMEISGMPTELPANLQAGQTLKDADVTMSIDMGIMKMKTAMKLTNGKCLAVEDITVPAGTFKCHKVAYDCTTTMMKREMKTRSVTWYALGVGTVKAESYSDKEKLQSSMELVSLQ